MGWGWRSWGTKRILIGVWKDDTNLCSWRATKVFLEWENSLTKIIEIETRKAFLKKEVDSSFWKMNVVLKGVPIQLKNTDFNLCQWGLLKVSEWGVIRGHHCFRETQLKILGKKSPPKYIGCYGLLLIPYIIISFKVGYLFSRSLGLWSCVNT